MRAVKKEKRFFSPLAALAVICGLLGFLPFLGKEDPRLQYLPQIVGIVLGLAAIVHMRATKGAVRGHEVANLGIVLCLITLAGVPMYKYGKNYIIEKQNAAICITNLKEIAKAVTLYETENERRVPANNWCEALAPYIRDEKYYACPSLKKEYRCGYFCNVGSMDAYGRGPGTPLTMVVRFCDGSGVWSEYGGSEKAVYRHVGKANLLFMDGHVGGIAKGDTDVIWNPAAGQP